MITKVDVLFGDAGFEATMPAARPVGGNA